MSLYRQHGITFPPPADANVRLIQEDILRGLVRPLENTVCEQTKKLRENTRKNYLSKIKPPGFLQLFRLLQIPDDQDFLHICYQVLLQREPDAAGFSAYWHELMYERQSRAVIVKSIVTSKEFQSLQGTWKYTVSLANAITTVGKFRGVATFIRWIWLLSNLADKNRTEQIYRYEIIHSLELLEKRISDSIEYECNTAMELFSARQE